MTGEPVIDLGKFPDMAGLVAYGKSRGVGLGWYQNDCGCTEEVELGRNYAGDIRSLDKLGVRIVQYKALSHRNLIILTRENHNRVRAWRYHDQYAPGVATCATSSIDADHVCTIHVR